ncbi:MAG TPA: ABC transporter permease, partial [Bryobacteraceae bacterium]|nr:ABC transporter permease [Bryobacteraceae bacterium]
MAVLNQATALVEKPVVRDRQGVTVWVTARQAFGVALEALGSHKLRSFLTLLGVVIATTTLIVVMSIVNGMNVYIADHIANLGTNTFVLHQFQWAQGFDSFLKARRRNKPIRIEDYEFLKENLRGYQQIGAFAQLLPNPRARYKTHLIDEIELKGMTPSFVDIGREKVAYGRYINDTDYQHNARVCVIGQDLVDKLFPMVDPLDKEVLLAGIPFR